MSIQKDIGIAMLCLALAGTALAEDSGARKFNYGPVYDAMDKNKDGKVNKEEWLASGLVQHTYDNLFIHIDGNSDLIITKDEFTSSSPGFEVDANKDGKVSLEEYVKANNNQAALATSNGGTGSIVWVKVDLSEAFDAMDKNKDGKINKEEWLGSGLTQDTYIHAFSWVLDSNKDQFLTKDEFSRPMEDGSELLLAIDPNKDQKVSLEEYVNAQNKTIPTGEVGHAPTVPSID